LTPPNPPTLDLEALEKLEREATPGPWRIEPSGAPIGHRQWELVAGEHAGEVTVLERFGDDDRPDAELAIALRNAAPSLIAAARELERLKAEAAELRIELAGRSAMFAELLQIHEVLAPYKTEGGSYLDAAAKLDAEIHAARERIGELEKLLNEALPWVNVVSTRRTITDPRTVRLRQRLRAALSQTPTQAASESEE
jgi:hypothetical protein